MIYTMNPIIVHDVAASASHSSHGCAGIKAREQPIEQQTPLLCQAGVVELVDMVEANSITLIVVLQFIAAMLRSKSVKCALVQQCIA